ncbi:MAG: hypothetical protein WBP72_19820 [Rhodocyclaceae bacterium]|jgi:hypothetical protein
MSLLAVAIAIIVFNMGFLAGAFWVSAKEADHREDAMQNRSWHAGSDLRRSV